MHPFVGNCPRGISRAPRNASAGTLLFLAALLPSDATPQAARIEATVPRVTQIDDVFARWDAPAPGCAVAVLRDGALIHRAGYGLAELEHDVPIRPETVFDLASTSKQFTAFVIVLLAERGVLGLDDDVREYLPELAHYPRFSIRQMLRHTSGVRNYFTLLALSGGNIDAPIPRETVLRLLALQHGPAFEPGTRFEYSNSNYALAAEIVRRVTGQPISAWAQREIFEPLGMSDTRFYDDASEIVSRRAASYEESDGAGVRRRVLMSTIVGDGGVYSTVIDLARWQLNLRENRLGSGTWAVVDTLLASGGELEPRPSYGLGLRSELYRGARVVGHGGTMAGYRSFVARAPEHDVDAIVLCNLLEISPFQLTRRIFDVVLGDELEPLDGDMPEPFLRERVAAAPPAKVENALDYAGTFRSPELPADWHVSAERQTLEAHAGLGAPIVLVPAEEPDRFSANGAPVIFERGTDGRVAALTVYIGAGPGLRAEKVPR